MMTSFVCLFCFCCVPIFHISLFCLFNFCFILFFFSELNFFDPTREKGLIRPVCQTFPLESSFQRNASRSER